MVVGIIFAYTKYLKRLYIEEDFRLTNNVNIYILCMST